MSGCLIQKRNGQSKQTLTPPDGLTPDRLKEIFVMFREKYEQKGLILNGVKLVDASIVKVPKHRNNKEKYESIKDGKMP